MDVAEVVDTTMGKKEIERRKAELIKQYGEWTYDILLAEGVWTRGNLEIPHTRLKRVTQIMKDLSIKSLNECRILDLGCLDGQFAIEFAMNGADVVGIEGREANIKKAIFARDILKLHKLKFVRDDVRNISIEKYGKFDIVLCSGIIYHLPSENVCSFVEAMYEITTLMLIIDTHISLFPDKYISFKGKRYYGADWREHSADDDEETKLNRLWSSLDNNLSFWFTRPSLINLLYNIGFTSIYECFNPPIKGYKDRCTFVAMRRKPVELKTSPAANSIHEEWEENELTYATANPKEIERKLKRLERFENHALIKIGLTVYRLLKKFPIGILH